MSIRSNSDLAVKRDETPVGQLVVSTDPLRSEERTQDALISAMPSEILTLYTALTGGALVGFIADDPQSFLPYRWVLLGFAVALAPFASALSYRRKLLPAAARSPTSRKAGLPWAEMSAATIAAAAWFMAAPGSPLLAVLEPDIAAMTSGAIVIAATAILWAGFGRQLRTGTKIQD